MADCPIPEACHKRHIAFVGTTGAGKTFAAKSYVERLLKLGRRVCVVDPTGVWWGLRASADGDDAGFPVVVFGGDHADVPIGVDSGKRLAELIAGDNIPCIVDPGEFNVSERATFMAAFFETLYQKNKKPLHLVIDEADDFAPQRPMPGTQRLLGAVERIVRRGRTRGFRVTMITQRPAVLNKNVLTQAAAMVAMRMPAPQDRGAIEDWIKGQADADEGKRVMKTLSRLKTGEGWVWAPAEDVLARATFPLITTFDSSRTPDEDETVQEPTILADVELGQLRDELAEEVEEEDSAKQGEEYSREYSREIARRNRELEQQLQELKELRAQVARWEEWHARLRNFVTEPGDDQETAPAPVEAVEHSPAAPTSPPPRPQPRHVDGLSKSAQALLDSWQSAYPRILTTRAAATRAGRSTRSSLFRPAVLEVIASELIECVGGDSYRAVSGDSATPFDSREMLEVWCSKFPPSTARMLREIVAAKRPVSRDEIAELADVSLTSSGLGGGLRELRVNGLIVEHSRGVYLRSEAFAAGEDLRE